MVKFSYNSINQKTCSLQVKASDISITSSQIKGITKYLTQIKDIGSVSAKNLVNKLSENNLETIQVIPEEILSAIGIINKIINNITSVLFLRTIKQSYFCIPIEQIEKEQKKIQRI